MNANAAIASLARFSKLLKSTVVAFPAPDWRWKPSPDDWSILEIVAHLADEEVQDFRMRVRLTLESPGDPWPGIDPPGWAVQRKYLEMDPQTTLERFLEERKRSLDWLDGLEAPRWDAAHEHPTLGRFTAGDLLCSWAAHDVLHWRQISKRWYQMLQRDNPQARIDYAGNW